MTMFLAASNDSEPARRGSGATRWLGLAASPTFAFMAWTAAEGAPAIALCASGMLPVDGMTAMYLLMSLFHLPPWLNLASGRRPQRVPPTTQSKGDIS